MKRFRRPVACLLLAFSLFALVPPSPSRAAYGIAVQAVRLGVRGAIGLARTGQWSAARGALRTSIGTFRNASWQDKLLIISGADMAIDLAKWGWKMIKNHPRDAADIAGSGAEAAAAWYEAMKDKGMPHTADAVGKALNPNQSELSDLNNIGDIYKSTECGRMEVISITRDAASCGTVEGLTSGNRCTYMVKITGVDEAYNCSGSVNKMYHYDIIRLKYAPDPDEPPQTIPDQLSDQQAERLLDEIEKKLQSHREEMEKELDELLKKNLDDIDWPDFDNDAAQEYLAQKRGQDLQDKIDEIQEELERKRQERENQCQQQQGDCQNKCCDTSCDESRLANRLDQLRDRLDDLNQQQEDQAVQEYDPPVITQPELKKIDFQPIVDLKGELMTKFPFNMLRLIPSAFEVLTAEPVAPYWDANLGELGGTHRVDFAVLNGLASFIRLVISWLCYIGAVFCCLKIWSRF